MDYFQQPNRLKRRIERYLVFRFAIILMGLGLVALYQIGDDPAPTEGSVLLYSLLGAYTLVGILSLAAAPRLWKARWFTPAQVSIDFAMGAFLTGITGGAVSIFCPVLFVTLVSACTVLRLKGAILFASLATIFLAAITAGYFWGYIPAASNRLRSIFTYPQSSFILSYLIAIGFALHIVAVLGSQLATGLLRIQNLQTEILENMVEGLIAIDPEGRIIQINGEARKILGLEGASLPIGSRLTEAFHAREYAPLVEALQRDGRRRSEIDIEMPHGKTLRLEIKVATVTDERGRFRLRMALINDLALKREIEEAERRIQQLEELYQMALGIAHEIRNPLASIRGCVQEIGRLEKGGQASNRLVEIVCRESDRLDRIIEDFMSYTRKSARPTQPIDMARVVDATIVLLQNHPRFHGRELRWNPEGGSYWILGNEERVQQVVLNLGLNALDSTVPGTGIVKISLRRRDFPAGASGEGEREDPIPGVEVIVEDNGAGIPPENLDKIFTPFFTSKERGTGLGLSIVHRIVTDHGGTIRVRSCLGQGSSFAVWFPMTRTPEEREVISAANKCSAMEPMTAAAAG